MRLEAAQGDGASLRTHLERAFKATGEMDSQLAEVNQPLRTELQALWDVYARLSYTRQADGGVLPSEIEAYGRLHGLRFTPWEASVLLDMDIAARAAGAQKQRKEPN